MKDDIFKELLDDYIELLKEKNKVILLYFTVIITFLKKN